MANLQRGLRIPVEGTTTIVHRGQFGPEGFTGKAGIMPAKGGRADLDDDAARRPLGILYPPMMALRGCGPFSYLR